jgi:hypothetical protein
LQGEIIKDPDHFFKRYEIVYSHEDFQRFEYELMSKLAEFRAWLHGELPTYRNEKACTGKFNCPFLTACSTGSMVGYAKRKRMFEELEERSENGGNKGKDKKPKRKNRKTSKGK